MSDDVERGRAGQLFEEFLMEQGILEDTNDRTIERVLAFQLVDEIKQQSISKAETARRPDTSRS